MTAALHELPLRCQVIETDPFGARWVIAAFDLYEDAEAFADFKREANTRSTYEVGVPAAFAEVVSLTRELFRPTTVTETLAERDQ